jgi:hypothetical protein
MPLRTPTTILPQRRPREERRTKVYSVAEYLMMLQEVETVRLNRQAREATQEEMKRDG